MRGFGVDRWGAGRAGRRCSGLVVAVRGVAVRLVDLGIRGADFVHVKGADLLDEAVESRCGQGAGLREDGNAAAEDHQGGDGGDARSACELLLVLGVDLAEGDVVVGLAGLLVDGCEVAAWTTPFRPEVEEDDVVGAQDVLKVLSGDRDGGHLLLLCLGRLEVLAASVGQQNHGDRRVIPADGVSVSNQGKKNRGSRTHPLRREPRPSVAHRQAGGAAGIDRVIKNATAGAQIPANC
ncbi:hypothetical protein SDC9_121734 [bioreactor metagenome]|uniref:Uncharacterized protein n=1 Tax=bioreactor metagenome TaxID=1076179 RepID=A0A645CCU2_9ZZZZ